MLEPRELRRWERLTAAMVRKAGADDPETFAAFVKILDDARNNLPSAAAQLRSTPDAEAGVSVSGYSWGDLARALGVSRQAAQKRFGRADA